MKINVDSIPQDGLDVRETIDSHGMSLEEHGVNFIDPIDAHAHLTKSGSEVFAEVELHANVEYTCAKCLAKYESVFQKEFSANYQVNPGDVLDIDEDIRQEIIVGSPMKAVCREGCKGLCPNCGQNLNIAQCEC
ncbi:MAG: DUF177 domain-containing protein [Candidatus Omnitrophota bacterium]|nr:DUF177 domain-containing protein [Candidatus Omnitrophota bacterium]